MTFIEKVKDFLSTRRQAYVAVFDSPMGDKVLRDLAKFCRAHKTTMDGNPRVSDMLTGRREVWLRIQHHLQLTDDQLFRIYHEGNE